MDGLTGDQPGPRVPVTVLTGFLGAGKTTLLNRLLRGNHGLRIAVLVNDFGSLNIDAELVVGVEFAGDVVSLANGCVCCNIRDDLMNAVRQVIERPEMPEHIVLEASGVAEPSGIAMTFLNASLRDDIRLDSIICVMDASQLFAAPETVELKLRQIAYSDMLVLNKTDLVGPADRRAIRAWLDDHFHRYRLLETEQCDVPLQILLSSGRFDAAATGLAEDHEAESCGNPHCTHHHHDHDHAQAFSTWSYETDRPISLDLLKQAAARLPTSIYRCKGVVNGIEAPGRRAILQVVGKRVDIAVDGDWRGARPTTRIVAIGAAGTIDPEALGKAFDQCVANVALADRYNDRVASAS